MKWVAEVLKVLNVRSCILVYISTFITSIVLLTVLGYLQSMYSIYEDVTYPETFREKPVIVVSSYSLAPFTSLISVNSIEHLLKDIKGVEHVFYQILTVVYLNNSVAVAVRGIRAEDFKILTSYKVIDGIDIDENCFYCIWVGKDVARELGIGAGATVTISSPFLSTPLILRVSGIVDTCYPYSHELIASLDLAQSIRGVSRDYVSVAVVVFSSKEGYLDLVERLGVDVGKASLLGRATIALRRIGREIKPSVYEHMAELFISRLGLSRDIYILISLAIAFVMSIGLYMVGQSLATTNSRILEILYEQGISVTKIKFSLAILLAILIVATTATSLVVAKTLSKYTTLALMSYPLKVAVSRDIALTVAGHLALFTFIGLATAKIHGQ